MKASRNPYRAGSAKRKAALAWLQERGIKGPKPVYPERMMPIPPDISVTVGPITSARAPLRKLGIV